MWARLWPLAITGGPVSASSVAVIVVLLGESPGKLVFPTAGNAAGGVGRGHDRDESAVVVVSGARPCVSRRSPRTGRPLQAARTDVLVLAPAP
jgi:hypothetical protein